MIASSGEKNADPMSIIDFLRQEASPEKAQHQNFAEQTTKLIGFNILTEALDSLPEQ